MKMNTSSALAYRPAQRWPIWCACSTAIFLHLAAIVLAEGRSNAASIIAVCPFDVAIDGEMPPEASPEPTDPPSIAPIATDDTSIPDENRAVVVARSLKSVHPIHKSNAIRQSGPTSGKAFAVSAPRPEYPYEARRQRMTGSGTALLVIETATGQVVGATMSESTGSFILDNATLSGLRRWRFKVGAPSTVRVPITFTLTGAAY
jgi:TonB family protein